MNIIIIGATSGIGKALFEKYVTSDNRLGIVGRRTQLLDMLRSQHPSNAYTATIDITKLNETQQAIRSLHKEFGTIDLAIVCSGTGNLNPSLDYDIERPTLDTNVMGWTLVVDMFYSIFEQQGHGHLVAITSVGGLRGESMSPAYSATKAYQINYMEALRKRAYKSNSKINITDVRPGLVDTAMAKGDGLFGVMPVRKVAHQICKAIGRKRSKVYITHRWHFLAIITKNLPFCLYKRL